jgi:hypothetical protein
MSCTLLVFVKFAAFTALTPVLFLVELVLTGLIHYVYARVRKSDGFRSVFMTRSYLGSARPCDSLFGVVLAALPRPSAPAFVLCRPELRASSSRFLCRKLTRFLGSLPVSFLAACTVLNVVALCHPCALSLGACGTLSNRSNWPELSPELTNSASLPFVATLQRQHVHPRGVRAAHLLL